MSRVSHLLAASKVPVSFSSPESVKLRLPLPSVLWLNQLPVWVSVNCSSRRQVVMLPVVAFPSLASSEGG